MQPKNCKRVFHVFIIDCTGTVNNFRSLHIRFDYYTEFLFAVVVVAFLKARKERLEHERDA